MLKKRSILSFISLILSISLSVTALTSCGNKKAGGSSFAGLSSYFEESSMENTSYISSDTPRSSEVTKVQSMASSSSLAVSSEQSAESNASTVTDSYNSEGNSIANILSYGKIAKQGKWLYFTDYTNGFALYKAKEDMSEKQKILGGEAECINVIGDWIFFVKIKDDNGNFCDGDIYKIKTDGTGEKKILEGFAQNLYVNSDALYFVQITWDNESNETYRLYKATLEGKEKKQLGPDSIISFCLSGDWIYYTNDKGIIVKMKTDGSSGTSLATDIKTGYYLIENNVIYYSSVADNDSYNIMAFSLNNNKTYTLVSGIQSEFLEFHKLGNWFFCNDESLNKTLSINISTKEKLIIANQRSYFVHVVGDYFYYEIMGNRVNNLIWHEIHRVKPDGTGDEILTKGYLPPQAR